MYKTCALNYHFISNYFCFPFLAKIALTHQVMSIYVTFKERNQ